MKKGAANYITHMMICWQPVKYLFDFVQGEQFKQSQTHKIQHTSDEGVTHLQIVV